jgi:hypothetical protein
MQFRTRTKFRCRPSAKEAAGWASLVVAQVFNLLDRRFPIGRLPGLFGSRRIVAPRRVGNPRYSRLETCATVSRRRNAGFTLAEVLAALLFMAIVIPVAVEGVRIASRAGEVAQRKGLALRVAERVLNEIVVTETWNQSALGGTVEEGPYEFEWTIVNEPWERDAIRQLSVQVIFTVQNQEHEVTLSTLLDSSQQYEQSRSE